MRPIDEPLVTDPNRPGFGPQDSEYTVPVHNENELVEELRKPDNRAKLMLAIAAITALTLLLSIITTITVLQREEPVLVDGVPCLVQEGENGESLLFCQR